MKRAILGLALTCVLGSVALAPGVAAHPQQHGAEEGHLAGKGAWGELHLVSQLKLTDEPEQVADVAVDPSGNYAYLAHWGEEDCAANSESGGINDPDAGVWVVDIHDPRNPKQVTFIPHSQDSRPGEGTQAVDISTASFDGTMLVTNNEQCGKNGKGGVSLYDVSNPGRPVKLSEHFGDAGFADTNDTHSAWAWDAGDKAYVVMTDNFEATDVDILDITNPKRPRLIADLNLNAMSQTFGDPISQPEIGLSESSLHDMVVKRIGDRFVMLLSYWDGGYVQLDVTDPTKPEFIGDTDYASPDPELNESAGIARDPEGNGHQAEFTADNRYFIATDEDFSPYTADFKTASGVEYQAGEFGWTVPIVTLPDKSLAGPTVFGGYGCPDDRGTIPSATTAIPSVAAGEERILVLQRGPVEDPSHSHGACLFSEKVESAQLAGYDAVIIANHHVGAPGGEAADAEFCGGQGHEFVITIRAVCVGHRAMHELFGSPPAYDVPYVEGTEPAIGAKGQEVDMTALYDGWGYVHLYDRATRAELDTYAIDEAHDETFAFGNGDLSVHEVATDPVDSSRAYLSYYAGGMRVLKINSDKKLQEVGGYLAENGSNFWGVEAYSRNGETYVLGSDRDYGLYVFHQEPEGTG